MQQKIVTDIWSEKYRYGEEPSLTATRDRLIDGVYANDPNTAAREQARALIHRGVIVPAGRIHAGAGTDKRVTLINCFVSEQIQDSMDTEPDLPGAGLMDALKDAALTQQMGGGIGMDFSTVRPNGSRVKRTGSVSTGVLPFMDMWNAMCQTIKSSGSRRGAMMGTLAIWHPDIEAFVTAKQQAGRLKNFNVSVLVTDAFMKALDEDGDWDLGFSVPRADGQHVAVIAYPISDRKPPWYVYKRVKARALWDKIIESTYIHAEPGVIFIDRVNQTNNLAYCETISCTNPCGEQPLPPNGDCNLGHVNLAVMVKNPFTPQARFDYDLLIEGAQTMVRLLDNVLDITLYPTAAQRAEAMAKRRIGLGYTGLANALQQLGIRYGSPPAVALTRDIGRVLRDAAYIASLKLAMERGSFPAYDAEAFDRRPFIQTLPECIRKGILKHGIRNGVLLTIAPTGTTSVLVGNVSSGIEPVFAHETERKVLADDGVTFRTYDTVYDYGYLAYHESRGAPPGALTLPGAFVTAADLSVREHLEMMAAAQAFIDASISKTINCPTAMTFEEFKGVYQMAYQMGLKGCTTYRPDPRSRRGAVLTVKDDTAAAPAADATAEPPEVKGEVIPLHAKAPMQDVLDGRRYRIKWPGDDHAYYVNINDYIDPHGVRRPFEIFISTKSSAHQAWISALTRTISAIFRREDNVAFLAAELQQVHSAVAGGMFYQGRYVPSLVAMIGVKIEEHLRWLGLVKTDTADAPTPGAVEAVALATGLVGDAIEPIGMICDACLAPAVVHESGCRKCRNCGKSDCG